MALPTFPAQFSIPPACFYKIQGLEGWLMENPSYKQYFAGILPPIIAPEYITCTMSSIGFSYEKIPLCSIVTTLPYQLGQQYNQQLQLFQKVYAYNSNAYVDNYNNNGPGPIYYRFIDDKERTNYKASVGLVNKLFHFDIMAQASTLNWQVPFPIYM